MYVATKGGETAINNAHRLLNQRRQPRAGSTKLTVEQVIDQQWIGISRVMTEGSVYDPELAALSLIQSHGDVVEAVFLVRAYRTTLPRLAISHPVETGRMSVDRRISAAFKDVPGGQILGPTFDYSHRLIDFDESPIRLAGRKGRSGGTRSGAEMGPVSIEESPGGIRNEAEMGLASKKESIGEPSTPVRALSTIEIEANDYGNQVPRVLDVLDREGLIEPASDISNKGSQSGLPVGKEPAGGTRSAAEMGPTSSKQSALLTNDLTREPLSFPTPRPVRLQALARGDEGFLLGLAYSTQRGYGSTHPFAGEIRIGSVEVFITPDELDFPIVIGEIEVTECEMINQFQGNDFTPPQFTRGYGLAFGQAERKTMSMALVDRALRAGELGETASEDSPAQDTEFVLSHADNVEASGFVQHLKLPHYVDFQAELVLIRDLRDDWDKANQNRTAELTASSQAVGQADHQSEDDFEDLTDTHLVPGESASGASTNGQSLDAQSVKVGV